MKVTVKAGNRAAARVERPTVKARVERAARVDRAAARVERPEECK